MKNVFKVLMIGALSCGVLRAATQEEHSLIAAQCTKSFQVFPQQQKINIALGWVRFSENALKDKELTYKNLPEMKTEFGDFFRALRIELRSHHLRFRFLDETILDTLYSFLKQDKQKAPQNTQEKKREGKS